MAKSCWTLCTAIALSGALACATPRRGAPAAVITDPLTGMELVLVKGGCYEMGNGEAVGGPEERPVHRVCVDDFYMGKFEVTQGQWKKVMDGNPSRNVACGDACPVETVSWNDAQDFLSRLNQKSTGGDLPAGIYRLPTEAEWEYAARGGGADIAYSGPAGASLEAVAWYLVDAGAPQPVGTRAPNVLGLFDMSGNVWEWTNDWYGSAYYASSPRSNPPGPATGDRRVLRGGSNTSYDYECRTRYRNYLPPDYRDPAKGFRIVRGAAVKAR